MPARARCCSTRSRRTARCSTTSGPRSSPSNGFLVGLSIDGPRQMHDAYRVWKNGRGSFDDVMRAVGAAATPWRRGQRPVHAARGECRRIHSRCTGSSATSSSARYLQFIPIIERATEQTLELANAGWSDKPGRKRLLYTQAGTLVTDRSIGDGPVRRLPRRRVRRMDRARRRHGVRADVRRDARRAPRHVQPVHPLADLWQCARARAQRRPVLVRSLRRTRPSPRQHPPRDDGRARTRHRSSVRSATTSSTAYPATAASATCASPATVVARRTGSGTTPDGEAGLNYLCPSYKHFFGHTAPAFRRMAELLRAGRYADEIMQEVATGDRCLR